MLQSKSVKKSRDFGSKSFDQNCEIAISDKSNITVDDIIYCPLSGCIFYDPVICQDGITYEKKAIQYYLVEQSKVNVKENSDGEELVFESPISGKKMDSSLIPNTSIQNLVNVMIATYPELKTYQFLISKPYYLFDDDFKDTICKQDYESLKAYFGIKLNDIIEGMDITNVQLLFNCKDNELVKYVLNNSDDYNLEGPLQQFPIHQASIFSNPEIIKYMCVDLGVEQHVKDILGNLPVHYMCKNQKITHQIYDIVTAQYTANIYDCENLCPIHIVSKYNNDWSNLIPFIQGCNAYHFNIPSKEGKYALHYLSQYAQFNTIKNVINLDIDLDVECLGDTKRKAADDFIKKNKNLSKEEQRILIRKYLNKRKTIQKLKDTEIKRSIAQKIALEAKELQESWNKEKLKKNEILEAIIKIKDDDDITNENINKSDVENTDELLNNDDNRSISSECSDVSSYSSGEEYEETITNFGEGHFDLENITEVSAGSGQMEELKNYNENCIIEIIDSGVTQNLNNLQIYDNYKTPDSK